MSRYLTILFLTTVFCSALFGAMNKERYIPLDEIEPGMEGYILTVYTGTVIEKFPVTVSSVVKEYRPGKDAIFVMSTEERFEHTGPIQGCSGSPVIIDGRIAGALAFGWSFVKDPLYGVTPIAEMLEISEKPQITLENKSASLDIDYKNLDFPAICRDVSEMIENRDTEAPMGLKQLEVPIVSSLTSSAGDYLSREFGIDVFSGSLPTGSPSGAVAGSCVPNFEPGSVISIPMVDGDIKMAAIGTVTDVDGDKVYAFGHGFDSAGKAQLPMACGFIHLVVANQISSFKFGQSSQTIGTITTDTASGIHGIIGEQPPLIPLEITVNRSDSLQTENYSCTVAKDDFYTPYLLQAAIAGAALAQGDEPKEHTVNYSASINVEGFDKITFSNTSSGKSISEAIYDTAGPVAAIMNNPFKKMNVTGIEFQIDIQKGESLADITYLKAEDVKFAPGEEINLEIFTEQRYSQPKSYKTTLKLPDDIPEGRYQIMICGSEFYHRFVSSSRQYATMVDDASTLMEVIRRKLNQPKNGLFVVMRTSKEGISIGKEPLEGLPESKAGQLASPKRNYNVNPIFDWIEKKVPTENIINGSHRLTISVKDKY